MRRRRSGPCPARPRRAAARRVPSTGHAAGHQHGRGQRAGERHAGARRRQDRRVDDDDVGHREEGGDAADHVGVQRAIAPERLAASWRCAHATIPPSLERPSASFGGQAASRVACAAAALLACVLLTACAAREAPRPIVVQGAMDVEIRKLAGAIQNAHRRARQRLDVLARHDRRLSRRDLQDPQGHGERGGRHRDRRRALPSDRDHQPGHRGRPRRRACTSTTSCSARHAVNLGSFKTGFRAGGRGSDMAEWNPLDLMRSDGSAAQDPNARTMRRFAADEGLLAAARACSRAVPERAAWSRG